MSNKNGKNKILINTSLMLFFVVCVFFPIISMFSRITKSGFDSVISSEQFRRALFNSLTTTISATVISLLLAFLASWCIERINIKYKNILVLIFSVPMLIPSISHSFGLIALFGVNGLVTNLLNIDFNIYGFNGIVLGSTMYSFPVAFLMFSNILKYEDGLQYKAADVLGIPKINQFISITLPYIKKTIISVFFSVFTMIITDYGVPLMIGGKIITLSVLMYNKAVSMIDYDTGSVIGSILLVPTFIGFIVDIINETNNNNVFVSNRPEESNGIFTKALAYLFCLLTCLCVVAPIMSFLFMTFETKYPINTEFTLKHIISAMKKGAGEYLLNSIKYAVLTSIFGSLIAYIAAYMNSRRKGEYSKILHLIAMLSMSIPGIVLGLSYVIYFHNKSIYGTTLLIMLVSIIHFFSSPYLMAYNAFEKLNPNLESVGESLGVKRIRIIMDVIIPKTKHTIIEMMSYYFVNTMMTISAISFLAPPSPKPIALMINQFEAQLLMESAAFVSLVILFINILVVISTKKSS